MTTSQTARYTRRMNKIDFKQTDLDKPVSVGLLLEYTDEFLIPRFAEVVKSMITEIVPPMIEGAIEKNNKKLSGQITYELKTYVDEKLNKQTEEIFTRLEKRFDRDKHFKEKLVEVLRAHRVGSLDEMTALEKLLTFQR